MTDVQGANEKRKFYLISTDILQGISVYIMVLGHTGLWWDHTLDEQYPNLPHGFFYDLIFILIFFAFLIPPGFLFWYTLNSVNSILRKQGKGNDHDIRSRLLKRAVVFFDCRNHRNHYSNRRFTRSSTKPYPKLAIISYVLLHNYLYLSDLRI